MSTQRYSVTPHPIETLLTWVKSREIAIPDDGVADWTVEGVMLGVDPRVISAEPDIVLPRRLVRKSTQSVVIRHTRICPSRNSR
ncbi:MAG: hypothetical protein EXS04_02850 [Phycisphaerales bacterium]|nr:hypothetical protein [Phycisphaerales bacterium]PHX76511.1 MAG: hypothetical protein CK544_06745 [Planctomycetaceae bacterium]